MSHETQTNSRLDYALYVSSSGWFTLEYPETWNLTENEECITICDEEHGVGALQVSAFRAPEPQDPTDLLLEHLTDTGVTSAESDASSYNSGVTRVATSTYVRGDGYFFKLWFITRDSLIVFITYNCRNEVRDVESRIIEEIVDSVMLTELI